MQECYLPTGNEWVSLPTLQARTGALESFSFLHMGYKGLIEQRGGASLPLMTPFFEKEGERASLQSLTWGRKSNWIPTFCGTAGSLAVEGMLLAPVGERGFLYQLTVRSTSDKPLSPYFRSGRVLGLRMALRQRRQGDRRGAQMLHQPLERQSDL